MFRPSLLLVFMVGGCTFEEARDFHTLNEQLVTASTTAGGGTPSQSMGMQPAIVLGGSTIHNSKR